LYPPCSIPFPACFFPPSSSSSQITKWFSKLGPPPSSLLNIPPPAPPRFYFSAHVISFSSASSCQPPNFRFSRTRYLPLCCVFFTELSATSFKESIGAPLFLRPHLQDRCPHSPPQNFRETSPDPFAFTVSAVNLPNLVGTVASVSPLFEYSLWF